MSPVRSIRRHGHPREAAWVAFVAAGLASVWACTETATEPDDLVVIEAFLYAGEPVTDIRVTGTIVLSSGDTTAPPINDAQVRLIKNGLTYDLVPSGTAGYYSYPGTDLTVEVSDVFTLEVTLAGMTATAETVVPSAPTGVAVSKTTVVAPEFGGGPGGGLGGDTASQVVVTWSNPSQELHFVVVESIEDDPVSFLPEQLENLFGSARFRMLSLPDSDDVHVVNAFSLRYYGQYEVTVYRINHEYAQLYENRLQDSRDLNEPPTNIRNGLGVFSAFSSDKVGFTVVEQ